MLAIRIVFMLAALSVSSLDGASAVPSRVVSLTVMTDEMMAELLPPDRILAYSRSADDPSVSNAVVAAKAVKVRAWLNLETLIALRPDLILAADWSEGADLDFLRSKGLAVYTVKTPRRWEDVRTAIAALGLVLSRGSEAQGLLARLDGDVAALTSARTRVTRPLTVLEFNGSSSMARGTLWNDMVSMAGLVNAASGLTTDQYGYAPLSRELLITLDPDWLVLSPGATLDGLRSDPLYNRLKAVRAGRVLFLSDAVKTTTSQAALGAAKALQNAAYPDLR